MNVLSLFDGISCSIVALKRANIEIKNFYACEIDKYAIEISKKNHPEIIHLGSVVGLTPPNNIDLLIGGSPCQDLSIAKKGRKGLDGERSKLLYEYVRIMKECNPKYFILENVNSMSKESKAKITEVMGVEPIMIDASLVSAQSRKRLFWTNIPVTKLPEDKGILLKDILQDEKANSLTTTFHNKLALVSTELNDDFIVIENDVAIVKEATKKGFAVAQNGDSIDVSFPKSKTRRGRVGNKVKNLMTSQNINVFQNNNIRKLTPIECERLQGLPDNYTEGISNTQRYKCLGNAFNVDVILHILKFIL